jgi:hypothetical protein
LSSKLWRHAAVGCCIVDCWVVHWCTDVSWECRISKQNAAVLLHNIIRNHQLLHRVAQLVHHQSSRVAPQLMLPRATSPKILSSTPNHQVTGVLHVCSPSVLHRAVQLLHHQGSRLYAKTYAAPSYTIKAPKYYTIKAPKY